MKKAAAWGLILSYAVLLVALGVMGLKIADHDYDFLIEAYIAQAALVVSLVCHLCRLFSRRCPHCGRLRLSDGKFCAHCGKEIE